MKVIMDDKYTFEDFGMRVSDGYQTPITPSFSHQHVKIPNRDEIWDFGSQTTESGFYLPIGMKRSDVKTKTDKFNKFVGFILDKYKKPRTIKFSFDFEPEKFVYAKLDTQISILRKLVGQDMEINFLQTDSNRYALSDAYDPEHIPEYDKVLPGDMYANSVSMDWIFRRSYSGFHNYSPFLTTISIKIIGTIKDASITHQQSEVELTLPDMIDGIMLVDTKKSSIILNSVSLLEGSNYNFFEILPGDNGFLFQSKVPNAKVTFEWLHEF